MHVVSRRIWPVLVFFLLCSVAGCSKRDRTTPSIAAPTSTAKAVPAPTAKANHDWLVSADLKKAKALGKNVYFEQLPGDRRRVLVTGYVSLREAEFGLECFLCRRGTKEHESVVAADADARLIHAGLVAAGAEPGHPVLFEPQFTLPTGSRIKVSVQYEENGTTKVVPAQQWIRSISTDKEPTEDWVFAGSIFYKDPDEPDSQPIYLATMDGAYICVTNVPTALLDLPVVSPKAIDFREFLPYTDRLPELFSKVIVILEPVTGDGK